ncbi:site-specific integrase [Defluviimonas aestuarii]|uniref:tyrosine-type recombinase/integrase n=1 Tax=Albidovulum aestuarii TaxID=1130726 RepID=UPI00249ACA0D|nr:site-specific integrase [Defluviimonas aestuarii]MDI3336657.1 site-specific integrase [Defluviimonas aestuarii]
MHAPSLADPQNLIDLPARIPPYWNILEFCRHIGLQKLPGRPAYWVARVRRKDGGYRQGRLAPAQLPGLAGLPYDSALCLAHQWFSSAEVSEIASQPYPVGTTRHLKYTKTICGFTIGDALGDYVEWKRVAASRTHFETTLSLINHHIIPRLGDVPVDELTSRRFTEFCRDVLETAPKRGKQKPRPKRRIDELDSEALRKRKKTVNALVSILRLALRMAWENGETDSDRAWRCLRRVPNADAPRHIFLSRDECRRLLAQCHHDLADLVRAALYTGCRVSELCRLRVQDLDDKSRSIYIQSSKNGKARYAFLTQAGMAFFERLCDGRNSDDLVFVMSSGRRWSGGHRHIFKAAVVRAGLPTGFVFHGLRHTYASQLVQAGMPLAFIARQLGHSNTDTVSRTYGHLTFANMTAELERRFEPIDLEMANFQSNREYRPTSVQAALEFCSWPSSNFFQGGGDLVRSMRPARLDRTDN